VGLSGPSVDSFYEGTNSSYIIAIRIENNADFTI